MSSHGKPESRSCKQDSKRKREDICLWIHLINRESHTHRIFSHLFCSFHYFFLSVSFVFFPKTVVFSPLSVEQWLKCTQKDSQRTTLVLTLLLLWLALFPKDWLISNIFLYCGTNFPCYLSWQLNVSFSLLPLSLTVIFTTSSISSTIPLLFSSAWS